MSKIKFEVTLELIEEMANCIYCCSWVSDDEISAYMKACITGGDYDPEEWSHKGNEAPNSIEINTSKPD